MLKDQAISFNNKGDIVMSYWGMKETMSQIPQGLRQQYNEIRASIETLQMEEFDHEIMELIEIEKDEMNQIISMMGQVTQMPITHDMLDVIWNETVGFVS